jgi:hypothetical protein
MNRHGSQSAPAMGRSRIDPVRVDPPRPCFVIELKLDSVNCPRVHAVTVAALAEPTGGFAERQRALPGHGAQPSELGSGHWRAVIGTARGDAVIQPPGMLGLCRHCAGAVAAKTAGCCRAGVGLMPCRGGSCCTGPRAIWAGLPRGRWSRAGRARFWRAVTRPAKRAGRPALAGRRPDTAGDGRRGDSRTRAASGPHRSRRRAGVDRGDRS